MQSAGARCPLVAFCFIENSAREPRGVEKDVLSIQDGEEQLQAIRTLH